MSRRPGLGTYMLLLLLGLILLPAPGGAGAQTASEGVPVTTASAEMTDVPVYLYGLGTVQPLNTVQIKAQVNGTLVALPVQEGQQVKQGEIIAQIDPRPYKASLDQATAQRDEDIAQLNSAKLDLQRYQDLAKRSFAPVQQVDNQQATVNKLTAAIAVDNALIDTARINFDYCTIRAPFDGRTGFHQVTVGNVIQTASQANGILMLVQNKPISIVLTLPASNLPQVMEARTKGPVPVTAFDGTSGKLLSSGTLMTPNNMIDTATATIALKATFENQDEHLWPGQFVNTRVQVGLARHAVTVPDLAVQHGPDGTFVYVVKPDQTVEPVAVTVGLSVDGRTTIAKGLSGNETVVESGQARLAPGVHIATTKTSAS